jgi:hypothetical protein
MSYGPAAGSWYQQAGTYTEGILKGAKPVDLSIEPNTKYELVINPPRLLASACRPRCSHALTK